ncbi:hypothetical protein [Mucilaginibacter gynuensis]
MYTAAKPIIILLGILLNSYEYAFYKIMRKLNVLLLALAMMTLNSCSLIVDIFKAGYYVGIIVVVIVLGIILWLFSLFRGR